MLNLILDRTCEFAPEQYDVFVGENLSPENVVGYLRLRHGHFMAQCWIGDELETVYEADTIGGGCFDEAERDEHLNKAKAAISARLEKIYIIPAHQKA